MTRHLTALATSPIWGLSLGLVAAVATQATAEPPAPRTISVRGTGTVTTVPDQAVVSLGVFVLHRDLTAGKQQVDAVVARLLTLIAEMGVSGETVSAAGVDISPRYSDSKPPEFQGYDISRMVEFSIRDLSKVEPLLNQAIALGANRQIRVTVQSSREVAHRDEALRLAVENAKATASRLAGMFGVTLGPVHTISTYSYSSGGAASGFVISGPSFGTGTFRPATIRFDADISATFLLAP